MFKNASRWIMFGVVALAVSLAPATVHAEDEEAPPIGWSHDLLGGLVGQQPEHAFECSLAGRGRRPVARIQTTDGKRHWVVE